MNKDKLSSQIAFLCAIRPFGMSEKKHKKMIEKLINKQIEEQKLRGLAEYEQK